MTCSSRAAATSARTGTTVQHVTVSIDVLVADTDARAREPALPEVWAMVRARRTGSSSLPSAPRRRPARERCHHERAARTGSDAALAALLT